MFGSDHPRELTASTSISLQRVRGRGRVTTGSDPDDQLGLVVKEAAEKNVIYIYLYIYKILPRLEDSHWDSP